MLFLSCAFFFSSSGDHRDLHSFPTRRSSDLVERPRPLGAETLQGVRELGLANRARGRPGASRLDRKSTRLNSSHSQNSYAVFCLKKKKREDEIQGATTPGCAYRSKLVS